MWHIKQLALRYNGCLRVHFYLKKLQTMVIETRIFGRYFLENEVRGCHSVENNWQYLLPMIKIQAFKWKTEFWKPYICHELDSFLILKGLFFFFDEIIFTDSLMLYNEMCQRLEGLQDYLKSCFPNNWRKRSHEHVKGIQHSTHGPMGTNMVHTPHCSSPFRSSLTNYHYQSRMSPII